MVEFCVQATFLDEGTDCFGIVAEGFIQALDRDNPVEDQVPGLAHLSDSARAEIADELVASGEFRSLC